MDTATATRLMEITTPLGKDLFHRMSAREELGRLSEFEIDLLSTRNDIKFADILSKNVTVKLELANKSHRYFNGFVMRFAQVGMRGRYHLYRASVRPWLWLYSNIGLPDLSEDQGADILKQVFNDHKIADTKFELLERIGNGSTAFNIARPTSTSSAGSWSRKASTITACGWPAHDGPDRLLQRPLAVLGS